MAGGRGRGPVCPGLGSRARAGLSMSAAPPVIQCVGECMVELTRAGRDNALISYSGDTYNTAVYLARVAAQLAAPLDVRFLSGAGQDPESDLMRARWRHEGL